MIDLHTHYDAEIELDVREAPLRELLLRVPRGYAIAKLTAAGLSQSLSFYSPPEAKSRIAATMTVSKRDLMKSGFQRYDRRGHRPIFCTDAIDDHLAMRA